MIRTVYINRGSIPLNKYACFISCNLSFLSMLRKKILFAFLCLVSGSCFAEITDKRLAFDIKPEFNRTFYFCWNVSTFGSVEFNRHFTLGTGISLGQMENLFNIQFFTKAEALLPFQRLPLYTTLNYIYNGMPDYKTDIHGIIPTLSLRGRWAGITIGVSLRLTVYNQEPPIFEPILALASYVNFYNSEKVTIGLRVANFDDFLSGNMGAYSLNLNTRVRVSKTCSLINDLEIIQIGSVGLAANFYGLVYRGGVVFNW
jgi:hypothetical protein